MTDETQRLQDEYDTLKSNSDFGSAELCKLGRTAADIANKQHGARRIIAYILRGLLFDLAERIEGEPIATPVPAGGVLSVLDSSIQHAIDLLKDPEEPLDPYKAMAASDGILDARKTLFEQPSDVVH